MSSNLSIFIDEATIWSDAHKASLVIQWKKYGKGHSLWPYNKQFHTNLLSNMSDADILYRADAGIPSYSDLAREVGVQRGIIPEPSRA